MSALAVVLGVALAAPLAAQVGPGFNAAPATREVHRIQLVNREGGPIAISRDQGRTWTRVGTIVRPDDGVVHRVQEKEFTASDWAPLSSVAATAVNAIHLKIDQEKHAGLVTLQPKEFLADAKAQAIASYLAKDASIYTDIPAGTGIFAADAPLLGNPLELHTVGGDVPLPKGYRPRLGDIFQIRVLEPVKMPQRIELENKFGGTIFVFDRDGRRRVGQVLRPMMGVGRFGGTQYAGRGEVRANHPGVLCLSTCAFGQIGGFQIVPSQHASHPDLDYVRGKPVWMVVGPLGGLQQDLEGTYPLFRGYFRPRRSKLEVRLNHGKWTQVPEAAGLKEGALKAVTHLAIMP